MVWVAHHDAGTEQDVRRDAERLAELRLGSKVEGRERGAESERAGGHDHICESLELFGKEVLPEFVPKRKEREERKAEELAPYIEKALGRKQRMPELSDDEIPIVNASRERESFYRKD